MIIQSKKVWIADQFTPAQLELEDGIIKEIYPYNEKEVTKDYGDLRILPGFIDIHCHGAYGFDTNDADPEGLRKWAKGIVDEGVTSFLATTLTQSEEVLTNAVSNVAKVVEEGYEGAEILGIHFEGPYLNKAHKGAQPEEYCVKPGAVSGSSETFEGRYQKAAHGLIKYITMAVENDEDYALTKYCSQNNVVVSIGHSNATYEQAVQAYAHGARSMTHVYNAMTPFTHRANGLVGGALRIRNMYGEIICDGNHSTLAALNNFFTSKGPDYSIMITDSLMCKGFPVGTKFDFGGQEVVIYPDGSAHLVEAGNLAGSTLNVNKGLKILIEDALVPVNYAINACTSNPARCLHVDDRKGTIGVGYDADLVVLDRDYEVVQTYCKGVGQK
jgi:N-acetylglucosamine-6-phosphate deacetylase